MNDYSTSVSERLAFQFHITLAMAVSVLRSVVAEFGESFVYEGSCVYVDGKSDGSLTPRCIVAQAFSRWGILRALISPRNVLHEKGLSVGNVLDYDNEVCNLAGLDSSIRRYLASIGITLDDDAFDFLHEAQAEQDARKPWGQALNTAAEQLLMARGQTVGDPLDRLFL